MAITLKNPHSILTTFQHRPGAVLAVRIASRRPTGPWREVLEHAQATKVPVERPTRSPNRVGGSGGKTGREGGNEADIRECAPVPLDDLFTSIVPDRADLWLALDRIQDPHNLGAIVRTAAFFGVRGMILTKNRSAPLSGVVHDTASGGLETVPFAIPPNLRAALDAAKSAGLWILGSHEHEGSNVFDIPRDRPWVLVLGNEMSGMRRLTAAQCDMTCRLEPRGEIASLNVSVAAGAMIAALKR